jgi:hypothetical protein
VGGVASTFSQVLSDDAVYEYRADRWWAEGPRLAFVGCNPSLITWQAGARLDPTSANCEAIARRDGYAGVTMLNLWALRGTDPRELRGHPDPIGPRWSETFDEAVRDVGFVVGAWGTAPFCAGTRVARRRIADVVGRLVALGLEVHCLGRTADGGRRTAPSVAARCVEGRLASTAAVRGPHDGAVVPRCRATAASGSSPGKSAGWGHGQRTCR